MICRWLDKIQHSTVLLCCALGQIFGIDKTQAMTFPCLSEYSCGQICICAWSVSSHKRWLWPASSTHCSFVCTFVSCCELAWQQEHSPVTSHVPFLMLQFHPTEPWSATRATRWVTKPVIWISHGVYLHRSMGHEDDHSAVVIFHFD